MEQYFPTEIVVPESDGVLAMTQIPPDPLARAFFLLCTVLMHLLSLVLHSTLMPMLIMPEIAVIAWRSL